MREWYRTSVALALAVGGTVLPLTAQTDTNPPGEWRHWGADMGSTRFSPLDQVNAENFEDLEVAWVWRGDNFGPSPDGVMRSTPIYADGTVYTVAGLRRTVAAIDPATGEALWTYREPHTERWERSPRRNYGRGVAYTEIAARCVPADSVGGDFYQLFRLPGKRFGIVIGDVSSHGFSAALIMALTLSAVGIYAPETSSPGEVFKKLHRALADELESTEMFLTLFYGVLDANKGKLVYANAGHPHAFRIGSDGDALRLDATSAPLGLTPLSEIKQATVPWRQAGDLLLLFTDGLSDALSDDGAAASGERRLVDEVVRMRAKPLGEIVDELFRKTDMSRSGTPIDDRTALLVRG
jgi:hypothetical protein